MIPTSKNVFIQIDTTALKNNLGQGHPSCEELRHYALIFDQGSMASGDAVRNFDVLIESSQEISFAILPLQLYSTDKLFFTRFELGPGNGGITVPSSIILDAPQVSFRVPVGSVAEGGQATFYLHGLLEYMIGENSVQIPIIIDPVLRANQGRG